MKSLHRNGCPGDSCPIGEGNVVVEQATIWYAASVWSHPPWIWPGRSKDLLNSCTCRHSLYLSEYWDSVPQETGISKVCPAGRRKRLKPGASQRWNVSSGKRFPPFWQFARSHWKRDWSWDNDVSVMDRTTSWSRLLNYVHLLSSYLNTNLMSGWHTLTWGTLDLFVPFIVMKLSKSPFSDSTTSLWNWPLEDGRLPGPSLSLTLTTPVTLLTGLSQNSTAHPSPVHVKKADILLSSMMSKKSYGLSGSFHHSDLHDPVATLQSGFGFSQLCWTS